MTPQALAEKTQAIFSLPDIALKVNELINSGESTNKELEHVILHDPALTAKILTFANSSYFGFSGKIDTVSRAISLIGHKELRNLVIATSVTTTFAGVSSDLLDMETFWFHSVTCGIAARLYAAHNQSKQQERFFITGLLHAIGKLVFISQFPEQAAETLRFKDQGEQAVTTAEREIFGFTHAELCAELLKLWKLPPSIWKVIESQLDPLTSESEEFLEDACILHVAANFANCIQPCANCEINFDDVKPAYKPEVWDYLGFDAAINTLIRDESGLQVFDVLGVIRPQTIAVC